jgi:hypothetical protein
LEFSRKEPENLGKTETESLRPRKDNEIHYHPKAGKLDTQEVL